MESVDVYGLAGSQPTRVRLQVPSHLPGAAVQLPAQVCGERRESLRMKPENSVAPLLRLCLLQLSSFILQPPGAPLPGSSDQRDGARWGESGIHTECYPWRPLSGS